jgi:hypothetical protein
MLTVWSPPTLSAVWPHLEVLGKPADAVLAQHGGCVAAHQRTASCLEDVPLVQFVCVRLPLYAALWHIITRQPQQPSSGGEVCSKRRMNLLLTRHGRVAAVS